MNHLNPLLLESMAKAMNAKLSGRVMSDCFSNSPDELVLDFDGFIVKCLFHKGEIYFFFNEQIASKSRLFKPQFNELKGLTLEGIQPHPFERSFHLNFEGGLKLLFKCHGRKSNVLLFENDACTELFKRHLETDANLKFSEAFRTVNPDFNVPIVDFKNQFPFLPKEFEALLKTYSNIDLLQLIADYRELKGIDFSQDDLSIHPSESFKLLDDISRFSANAIRNLSFIENKFNLRNNCLKAIHEKENFVLSNRAAIDHLKNKRPDGEIGNIILANMHLIPAGAKSVELMDIYNNHPITVALDEKLSAVENAERYFKKEKSVPYSIQLLETKVQSAEKKLQELRQQLSVIDAAGDSKALKPILKVEESQQKEETFPYRKFSFQGYDILVGKHADSNEKLLNYYSDKNDVWLHAKDVSGSHVIVKVRGKQDLPQQVLEHAASIAAYYSKNRNQELATVSHTLRKFVRKIKGADKGKVTISNEKSLLVKPFKGSNT